LIPALLPFFLMSFQLKPGVWQWKYDGGEFEVSFVAGGEFICAEYPEHASWKGTCCGSCSETIIVEWGQFGNYTMTLTTDGGSMKGFYTGYEDDWRTATFLRAHTDEELASIRTKAASNHGHQHTSSCNH
jgi:hypothetical protein